jgi:hypothetical protein
MQGEGIEGCVSIISEDAKFFTFAQRSERLWGITCFLSNLYGGSFPKDKRP